MKNESIIRPVYPHAIVIVTLVCNLRCKLCILCVPYYHIPWHPTTEYIKQTTDRAFLLGDYEIFEFNGGEPLLRDDLTDIFEHALQYKDNVKEKIKTVTNGTILPTNELLCIWKHYGEKFHCIVDDYGADISTKAREAYEMVKSAGISCELRDMHSKDKHHGGWANFWVSEIIHTEEEAEAVYAKCGQAKKLLHCCNIIRGFLMPCHLQFQLNDKGLCKPKSHEFIDLFDDEESLTEKRNKMAGFQVVPSLSACRYCNGLNEYIERHSPAEQISDFDYKSIAKIIINQEAQNT